MMEKAASGGEISESPVVAVPSRPRILKNLVAVSLGFFFLYLPFQSLANLQSTLNFERNVGVVSQTVMYATFILSALLLPKLLIRRLGCKGALLLCALAYLPYFAANFSPSAATFVPTALLLGAGGGPLWSAKCTYVNEIAAAYAAASPSDTADAVTSRFFGVFYLVFQNTQIWGNLVSYHVLRPREGSAHPPSRGNVTCGAAFCGGMNENLLPPPGDQRTLLIGVYLGSAALSALILLLFLDPLGGEGEREGGSVAGRVAATLRHLRTADQLLLVPLTVFNGIEQAFILGDYSKAYVACAWGVHNVCLVFVCYGLVNACASFLSGRLSVRVPRAALFLSAAASNLAVCAALLLWEPDAGRPAYFFVLVGLWGLSDAVWLTQLNGIKKKAQK